MARGPDRLAYDQANRLKSATVGSTASTHVYDGDGKRVSATVGTNPTVTYRYDVNRSLPVVLDDGSRKYVWGLGLAYAVDNAGNVEVYHADGLGSVRAITDGTGQVVQTYLTDEFGVSTLTQGTRTQPFQYTGEQRDGETGFVYLRARMYEPGIGRFIQRDPFSGTGWIPMSLNRYAYALSNPVKYVDPSGLDAAGVCLSGAYGGVGLHSTGQACVVVTRDAGGGLQADAIVSAGRGGTTAQVTYGGGIAGIYSPNAQTVSDLTGLSAYTGFSTQVPGTAVGVEVDVTTNPTSTVYSGQVNLVGGNVPPTEFHGGGLYTWQVLPRASSRQKDE